MRRFTEYGEFVRRYLVPSGHIRFDDAYFSTDVATIDGVEVAVYCLNSSWLSASDLDRGRLVLGERQIRKAVEGMLSKPLRIALIHHPLEWIADWEPQRGRGHLAQEFLISCFMGIATGKPSSRRFDPRRTFLCLPAAQDMKGRHLINMCNVVKLDLSTGDGAAVSLRYSDQSGGFWVRDTLNDPESRRDVYRFAYARRYVPAVPEKEPRISGDGQEIASPQAYSSERLKDPEMLHELTPDMLVDIARQAPAETLVFLNWMSEKSTAPSSSGSLLDSGAKLSSAMA